MWNEKYNENRRKRKLGKLEDGRIKPDHATIILLNNIKLTEINYPDCSYNLHLTYFLSSLRDFHDIDDIIIQKYKKDAEKVFISIRENYKLEETDNHLLIVVK